MSYTLQLIKLAIYDNCNQKCMSVSIMLAVVLGALILWLIGLYNGLIRLKNRVKEAWSDIDVQLKRRHDLIPNLVNSVKGYMKHEKELLENVT